MGVETVERYPNGSAVSEGDLYQLPAVTGLRTGDWVYIAGHDHYGQVIRLIEKNYPLSRLTEKHAMLVHNIPPGGYRCGKNVSLYLVRGRCKLKPPPGTGCVSATVTVN